MAMIGVPFGAYMLDEMGINPDKVVWFTLNVRLMDPVEVILERLTDKGTQTERHQPDTMGRLVEGAEAYFPSRLA